MTRKWIAMLLVALLLPCAALADGVRPMGRYMESEIAAPEGDSRVLLLFALEDGRLGALCGTNVGFATYTARDDGWEPVDDVRLDGGFEGVARRGEDFYLLGGLSDADEIGVLRHVDGEWVEIGLDFGGGRPLKIDVATDGTLLVQCSDAYILAFNPATGEQRTRFDGLGSAFTVQSNGLLAVSMDAKSVLQYDLNTGALLSEMKDAPVTGQDVLASDGQSLFLGNRNGIYRIAVGGTIWEQLVDGSLTNLSKPDYELKSLVVAGGDLCVLVKQNGVPRILRYRYDTNVNARPLYELNVCTLQENPLLTQAVLLFQQQNPECRVKITALVAEGVTADDALRALNAELLAGKGPDVLLLDGMPVNDYIEQGILADISGVADELTGAGELAAHLVDPLRCDGKLFCVPTACVLPVALSKPENLDQVDTLDALLALVQQSDAVSPVAWRTRQGYFDMFLAGSYPAWFQVDGQLDEEALGEYLAFVDALYRANVDPSQPNQATYLQYADGPDVDPSIAIGMGS